MNDTLEVTAGFGTTLHGDAYSTADTAGASVVATERSTLVTGVSKPEAIAVDDG